MPSSNLFWCNLKLIVVETFLMKNNVVWFTIYMYVLCQANIIIVWCVYELWGVINYYNEIIILLWILSGEKLNVPIEEIHANMRWLIVT